MSALCNVILNSTLHLFSQKQWAVFYKYAISGILFGSSIFFLRDLTFPDLSSSCFFEWYTGLHMLFLPVSFLLNPRGIDIKDCDLWCLSISLALLHTFVLWASFFRNIHLHLCLGFSCVFLCNENLLRKLLAHSLALFPVTFSSNMIPLSSTYFNTLIIIFPFMEESWIYG